ncbi:MAG: hypothetical protein IT371_00845 [Deltaproteobacteria bacterium]|nr:hypothetical protein [Deltaproteobacteria bacterium]
MRRVGYVRVLGAWLGLFVPSVGEGRLERETGEPQGLRIGAELRLRHPRTGRMNEPARILGFLRSKSTGGLAVAVLFRDGVLQHGPLEKLRLEALPFGSQRRRLRALKREVREALRDELGLDASSVPIFTLRSEALQAVYRQRHGKTDSLAGLHSRGQALVSRNHAFGQRQTMVHEVIHGLSQPFIRSAPSELYEGITEYFAYRVAIRRFGYLAPQRGHSYYPRYLFALRVAELVGERALQRVFFSPVAYNLTGHLETLVDHALGRPGTFAAALAALRETEGNDAREAVRLLGGPPRTDNPWR